MLARLYSVTLVGIEGITCEVEVDVARGGFEKSLIVGLPDAAVKESTERVKSAIINCGYKYPKTQSLINLAPADVKKAGPAFDLPIALGMLIGQGTLVSSILKDFVIIGELALDGRVREINGILSMAMTAAANGFNRMIVPLENAEEAAVVQDIEVYLEPMGSGQALAELVSNIPVIPDDPSRGEILLQRGKRFLDSVPAQRLHFLPDDSFWKVIQAGGGADKVVS